MIRIAACVSSLALAGCASVEAPPRQMSSYAAPGLSPQDVATGFSIAVLEGCVAPAESGKTLEEAPSERIVRETAPDPIRQPKPGQTAWAPVPGQGIVTIHTGGGSCDVSAYGPPVAPVFDGIAHALTAKGYQAVPITPEGPRHFASHLTKTADGRTVSVMLIGNEPGAAGRMSRFSGLSAFVTVKTP